MKSIYFISKIFVVILFLTIFSCNAENTAVDQNTSTCMDKDVANCEYHIVTIKYANGETVEISINDLPVQTFSGAQKLDADTVEIVERRGVAFKDIMKKGNIQIYDGEPVNIISRDGWDPYRTRLEYDVTKLPTLKFYKDYAYVYVGNAGETDPLYPQMEGKALNLDFNLSEDSQVPAILGGTLSSLNIFRARMLEKVDEDQRGIIELAPVGK